ncbi:MAG: GntR family transcriptional regulator [Candidatus Nanopelagicales bacterium]
MTATEPPRRPPTAQEFVLAELRRSIVSGELRPGEQIRQEALAERLGTSRVPLREALKILEGEGQVAYHPHRGYFVAELSSADLVEVYRIRRLLEDEAVAAALPLLTDEDLAALQDAVEAIEQADAIADIPAMTRANRSFHFLLIDSVGMPRLTRLIRQLWDATDAYRSMYFVEPENREQVRREHREILAAVTARDLPRTLELLHAHQDHAVERVSRVLGH